MPFLHYETDAGRESIAKAVESARQSGLSRKTPKGKELKSADERLIHAYLHEKPFMHVRRTLDQYYYHTMKDTKQRDRDQVVFRWAKRMWPDDPDSVHNILMVDQLWLWILDGGELLPCRPPAKLFDIANRYGHHQLSTAMEPEAFRRRLRRRREPQETYPASGRPRSVEVCI